LAAPQAEFDAAGVEKNADICGHCGKAGPG